MVIRTHTGAVVGIGAVEVSVEVSVTGGGLGLFLVGLPDNAVRESEQRIRSAFENSGFRMTARKCVVNLAPADLRKEGSGFDLPIAVAILAATEQVAADKLSDSAFVGELSLHGAGRECCPWRPRRARKVCAAYTCRARMPPRPRWWRA